VNGLANLQSLTCNENGITTLNLTGLTNLQQLTCFSNALTSLSLSGLTTLASVNCSSNLLTSLTFSNSGNITSLDCQNNLLTTLDVSSLHSLQELFCNTNALTTLYIQNSTIETIVLFYENPNLTYICADAGQISAIQNDALLNGNNNCTVDASCALATTIVQAENKIVLYPNPASEVLHLAAPAGEVISEVSIYTVLGQKVMELATLTSEAINVSELAKGTYVLKARVANRPTTIRFLKE
jgi:Leucine-rich repeat (LRR) protein